MSLIIIRIVVLILKFKKKTCCDGTIERNWQTLLSKTINPNLIVIHELEEVKMFSHIYYLLNSVDLSEVLGDLDRKGWHVAGKQKMS